MEKKIGVRAIFVLLVFVVLTVLLHQEEDPLTSGTVRFLAPPPEHVELFHFGFSESLADSFWLRWIQDADLCQTFKAPSLIANSIAENPDKDLANPRHKVCDQSWGFKMLDAVTKLAPKFEMPYLAGAITLSVLVEDYQGASVIFDRGIAAYPNDWQLLYRAAYHFLYDVNDLQKAAMLLQQAGAHGAPAWLNSLAARLYSKAGQLELGIQALETYLKSLDDKPEAQEEVKKRIAELREKLSQAH